MSSQRSARMSARETWNFIALAAFVVLGMCYLMLLGSVYFFFAAPDSAQQDPRGWAIGGAVSLTVLILARLTAKAQPQPGRPQSQMRIWAHRFGADHLKQPPTDALEFERIPLSRVDVSRSGPAAVTRKPERRGVSLVRAHLSADGGASRVIGSCVAWYDVQGSLPALSLVRADFDPALISAFGIEELGAEHYGLAGDWRAFGSMKACADVLTPPMVRFLTSIHDNGVAVQLEPHRVVVWSDRGDSSGRIDRLNEIASEFASALPKRMGAGVQPDAAGRRGSGKSDKWGASARLGDLKSTSKIRSRLLTTFLVSALVTTPPLFALAAYVLNGFPLVGGGDGLFATLIIAGVVVVSGSPGWVASVLMKRLDKRHDAIAREVLEVAASAGLVLSPRASFLERAWGRRPFSTLLNIGAAPSASTYRAWGSLGVAYIEGDIGSRLFLVKAFQSRVAWAQVSGGLPRMDFVREGFATRAAKLVGGTDLDTESYAFNRLWRIKTDDPQGAHAMLQPLMIEFLTSAAEDGIAIHLDGDRVVMWDDGTDHTADLATRFALIERFVDCLPGHLRTAGMP